MVEYCTTSMPSIVHSCKKGDILGQVPSFLCVEFIVLDSALYKQNCEILCQQTIACIDPEEKWQLFPYQIGCALT